MTDENDTVKVDETTVEVDDLGLDDNYNPESVNDLLKEKNRLQADFNDGLVRLFKKQKFNRGDLVKAFARLQKYLNFVDSFQELLINDLQIIDGRFKSVEENLFKIGQQQSILITALKTKTVIVDEDMVKAWEEVVKPTLETRIAEMKSKMVAPEVTPETVTTASEEVTKVE